MVKNKITVDGKGFTKEEVQALIDHEIKSRDFFTDYVLPIYERNLAMEVIDNALKAAKAHQKRNRKIKTTRIKNK